MIPAGRTLAFTTISNCMVYVSSTSPPSDSDWDEYLAYIRANFNPREHGKALVFERAGGLSAPQRQRLDESTAHLQLAVAVVTDSRVTRLVVNAMSWVKRGYRAFPTNQLDEAVRYLERSHDLLRIKGEIKKLVAELDRGTSKPGVS